MTYDYRYPYYQPQYSQYPQQLRRPEVETAPPPTPNMQLPGYLIGKYAANQFSTPATVPSVGGGAGVAAPNLVGASHIPSSSTLAAPEVLGASKLPANSSLLGGVGPAVGLAGVAYAATKNFLDNGGKELVQGEVNKNNAINAVLDTNPVTGWINPIAKALGGKTLGKMLGGSGKGEDQQRRDAVRDKLEEAGFFGKNNEGYHTVKLADGSFFNVGRDIGENREVADSQGKKLHAFDLTPEEIASEEVGALNPLIAAMVGGDDKLTSDFTGYLTQAARSKGDSKENVKSFYNQAGLGERELALNAINDLHAAGRIDDWEKVAYQNGINEFFGDDGSGSYKKPSQSGPHESHKSAYEAHFGTSEPQSSSSTDPSSYPTPSTAMTIGDALSLGAKPVVTGEGNYGPNINIEDINALPENLKKEIEKIVKNG